MIYLTGDTHRDFERFFWFCKRQQTHRETDLMIILGDVGLNYYGNGLDKKAKQQLSSFPITFLCIHGNHEMRPETIESYEQMEWNGGRVYVELEFPNILFARDGDVYDLCGIHTMVIGGAYSVDKEERLEAMDFGFRDYKWFPDEQPSEETKQRCENVLQAHNHQIDVMLTHTCPMSVRPVHAFLPSVDQETVDTSTEEWLQTIKDKTRILRWYSGHYHVDETIDNHKMLYRDIVAFPTKEELYGSVPV